MPTIAPSRSSLQVMPGAPSVNAALFTQVPDPAAGMQMFEQAAKLPLLMEQIKMEKYKQKAEKAKLDLAELTAQQQMSTLEKDAARQNLMADIALKTAQDQGALAAAQVTPEALGRRAAIEGLAADPAAAQRAKNAQAFGVPMDQFSNTPEGRASLDRDIALNGAIQDHFDKGGNLKTWVAQGGALPETGTFGAQGATEEAAPLSKETVAKAPVFNVTGEAPLATATVAAAPSAQYFAPSLPTVNVPEGMKPIDRAVAISKETGETPSAAYKRLGIKDVEHTYVDPETNFKWKAVITQDNEGNVYNRYSMQLDGGAKDPAATRVRVAALGKARNQVMALKEKIKKGKFKDAFGVVDATTVGWLNDPTKAAPLRAVAGAIASDDAIKLSGELSVTAKFLQELAGSALSAGEAKRYDPYVPGSTDLVLGEEMLIEKMDRFERMLGEEEASLLKEFPNIARRWEAGAVPVAPRAKSPLEENAERTRKAVENIYRSKRA